MNRSLPIVTSTQIKRLAGIAGVVLGASLATFMAVRARAAGIPAANALTYTGYLEKPDGTPITDVVDVTVSVWDALNDGNKVCEATSAKVKPVAGRFQLALPDCTAPVGASPDLWLEVTVGVTSLGRTKLGAVPYAVEANHASAADAAAEGSPLATQLATVQADIDSTKGRLDAPLATNLAKYSAGAQVTIDKSDYFWVSGTAPAKLAPGRYWTLNTGRTWAINTASCTSQCESAVVFLAPCMKVGSAITPAAAEVVAEPPKTALSLPFSAIDFFDIAKETANVELGLCAKRSTVGMGLDAIAANVYSVVLAQPK